MLIRRDMHESKFLSSPETGDVLKTIEIVREIEAQIPALLDVQWIRSSNLISLIDRIKICTESLDNIFNPPPREEDTCERRGPSIAVYTTAWGILFINSTYIDAAEPSDASEAKTLAQDGYFMETIYPADQILWMWDMGLSIPQNTYDSKILTMNSGFKWRWKILPHHRKGGIICIAEDLTDMNPIIPLFSTEGVQGIPFGFYNLVYTLRENITKILEPSIVREQELESFLNKLSYISSIGDMIVDEGPFFIVIKWGEDFLTVNKSYVAATGYSLNELQDSKTHLYRTEEEACIEWYLKSLKRMGHYHGFFDLRRKDKSIVRGSWDTFAVTHTNAVKWDLGNWNSETGITTRVGALTS